jgi:hypothetical protein
MPLRIFISLIILGLFVCTTAMQCYRNYPQTDIKGQYGFKEGADILPYRVNYNVGDTIWINLTIPGKRILDTISGLRIFYDSANFNSVVQVDLLYKNPFTVNGALADFVFPLGVSAYTNTGGPQTFSQVSFGCAPSADYQLLLGIVLKQQGILGISFYNSYLKKCFSNSYDRNSFSLSFNVNDPHKNLYLQQSMTTIGKTHDPIFLNMLDRKTMVAINVQ